MVIYTKVWRATSATDAVAGLPVSLAQLTDVLSQPPFQYRVAVSHVLANETAGNVLESVFLIKGDRHIWHLCFCPSAWKQACQWDMEKPHSKQRPPAKEKGREDHVKTSCWPVSSFTCVGTWISPGLSFSSPLGSPLIFFLSPPLGIHLIMDFLHCCLRPNPCPVAEKSWLASLHIWGCFCSCFYCGKST